MDPSADLLALLTGGSAVSSSALHTPFSAPPPTIALGSPPTPGDNLLDLLRAGPSATPVQSPPATTSARNDLLAQLFGSALPASTPAVANPPKAALDLGSSPQMQHPKKVNANAVTGEGGPVSTPSPFDFVSPFDILARTPPRPSPRSAHKQSQSRRASGLLTEASPSAAHLPRSRATDDMLEQHSVPPAEAKEAMPAAADVDVAIAPLANVTAANGVVHLTDSTVDVGDAHSGNIPSRSPMGHVKGSSSSPKARVDQQTEPIQPTPVPPMLQTSRVHLGAKLLVAEGQLSVKLGTTQQSSSDRLELQVTPIVRFPVPIQSMRGETLALPGQTIAYATKLGRIRVLDRATGARHMLRLHNDALVDMQAAPLIEKGMVTVASCGRDGRLIIWRVPSHFDDETARHTVLAIIKSAKDDRFAKLKWSPDGRRLGVLTSEGHLVILDLEGPAWQKTIRDGVHITERDALAGQQMLSAAGFVDLDFSQDGAQVLVIAKGSDSAASRLNVLKADDLGETINTARLDRVKVDPVQLIHLEDGVAAVTFGSGCDIEVMRTDGRFLSIFVTSDDTVKGFSKVAWHSPTSALYVSHSKGSIWRLEIDLVEMRLVSTQEISFDEPIVAFLISRYDSSIFCILASGISQVHLPHELFDAKMADSSRPSSEMPTVLATAALPHPDLVSDGQDDREESPSSVHRTSSAVRSEHQPESQKVYTQANGLISTSANDDLFDNIKSHLEHLAAHWSQERDSERSADKAAELARQEQILHTISTALTTNTRRAIDATIRSEIQSSLVPVVHSALKEAVNAEVIASANEAMKATLPGTLDKLLQRPDLAQTIGRQISAAAKPIVQETVANVVTAQLATGLQKSVSATLDRLIDDVRSEMVDIRKAIVAEQSTVLAALRADVAALGAQIDALQASQSASVSMPGANPRAVTPPQILADQILRAVQSSTSADDLDAIVLKWDQHRSATLFSRPSPLSLVHLLGLAHKLAEMVSSAQPPLSSQMRTRLRWISAACDAIDKHSQPEVAVHVPLILGRVLDKLGSCSDHFARGGDAAGAQVVTETLWSVHAAIKRP